MRQQSDNRSAPPRSSALKIQTRVVEALIVRDMMLRYGRNNIGFLWIVIEPMLLTVGVMVIWSLARAPIQHGIPVVALVLSGYMPLTLWRHTTNSGLNLIRNSVSTLYHRHLTLLDVVVSRMLSELAGVTLALMLVYGTLFVFELVGPIQDPGLLVAGWLMMAALGSSVGILVAAATEYNEATERLIQPLQYLLMPISGAFFVVEWLPKYVQDIAWYNPLVHCYELFRAGLFGESVPTYHDAWYPMAWSIVLTFIGLHYLDRARERFSGS